MTALDPRLQAMLDQAAGGKPMHQAPIEAVRKVAPRVLETGLPKEEVARVEDLGIPTDRRTIPARLYRPAETGVQPLIVFFHGGGFSICSIETHDGMCRQICRRSGAAVLSVDYRLAPEHPFPAGPDDTFEALRWAAREAGRLGVNPAAIALCGDSAGGALAALTALRARDEGGPSLAALLLIYPVLEHYAAGHGSYEERGQNCGLTREDMRWFWDMYLPGAANALAPEVSPGRADLSGLPPTFLLTAEHDVLRDEGLAFARKLEQARVPLEHRHCADMNHGFLNWCGVVDGATDAMAALGEWARANLQAAAQPET